MNNAFAQPQNQSKIGILGHSMGGGGAIQCALKNQLYKSYFFFYTKFLNCVWFFSNHIRHKPVKKNRNYLTFFI